MNYTQHWLSSCYVPETVPDGFSHFLIITQLGKSCCWSLSLSIWAAITKTAIDWVAYKQQKFISHSSGGWKIQNQGTNRLSVWRKAASLFTDDHPSTVVSHGVGDEGALWGLSHKDTKLIYEASPSWPNHLPKAPLPNSITLGIRFKHELWENKNIQSIPALL